MMTARDDLELGRAALSEGRWNDARRAFEAAVQRVPSMEAYENLGLACWWLDDPDATLAARERAYALYRQAEDWPAAGRLAIWLAWDYLTFRGEPAIANGWIQRAHRLLDGLALVPEQGWLALREGEIVLMAQADPVKARELALRGAEIGRALRQPDLEMLGMALEGLALVTQGEVATGMARLDEAVATATAERITAFNAAGTACCYLIAACERVWDFDRAAQWCDHLNQFCRRWQIPSLLAVCRSEYGTALLWRGMWQDAETELTTALDWLTRLRPGMATGSLLRLADLRRRQGHWEEASALLAQCSGHPLSLVARAALELDRGANRAGLELAERYLRQIDSRNRIERVPALEIVARAASAEGVLDRAAAAVSEIQAAGEVASTRPLRAAALSAEGILLAAKCDWASARARLEDAIDAYKQSGIPHEAALTQLDLARALTQLDRRDAALRELAEAAQIFERLGARHDVRRAAELRRDIETSASDSESSRLGTT
jgi:tetratricopeptide (TPR) repeat protein